MQKKNERDADLRDKVDMQCPAACAQPRGDRGDGDRRQHRDKKGIELHYRGRASDVLISIIDMPSTFWFRRVSASRARARQLPWP
jgi:hypothetical protein